MRAAASKKLTRGATATARRGALVIVLRKGQIVFVDRDLKLKEIRLAECACLEWADVCRKSWNNGKLPQRSTCGQGEIATSCRNYDSFAHFA
jgi:hypothetical protein